MAAKIRKNRKEDETLTYVRKDFLQEHVGDFLKQDEMVLNRWKVIGKLGEGTHGKVYAAHDNILDRHVAIKCCKGNKNHLLAERKVLLDLKRSNIVTKYIAFNTVENINFLVTDLQGPSLSKLKEFYGPISLKTTLEIGLTTLQVLGAFHDRKYIHSDVKPSNIVIGPMPEELRRILLIDLSLARQYDSLQVKDHDQEHFYGTLAYAGPPRHLRERRSPLDDLYCLLYTILELRNDLPWKHSDDEKEILRMKLTSTDQLIKRHVNSKFLEFKRILDDSSPNDPPNCKQLEKIFLNALNELGTIKEDPYEWEVDPDKFWNIKYIKKKDKKLKLDPLTGEECQSRVTISTTSSNML